MAWSIIDMFMIEKNAGRPMGATDEGASGLMASERERASANAPTHHPD